MQENYFWKKTEEIEIDLVELFQMLLGRWRQISLCAVICAVFMACYSVVRYERNNVQPAEKAAEESQLLQMEQQAVTNAIRLTEEIESTEEYMIESVLMQIDPFRKEQCTFMYSIDNTEKNTRQSIMESYVRFFTDGRAADAVRAADDNLQNIDTRYLSELFTAYLVTENTSNIFIDKTADDVSAEAILHVEVTGKDSDMTKQLAEAVQKALQKYTSAVKQTAGSHTLTLISSQYSTRIDDRLREQQQNKQFFLMTYLEKLKTMTDTFSEEQKEAFVNAVGRHYIEYEDMGESSEVLAVAGFNIRSMIKYVLFGIFAGAFLCCAICICFYLLHDTIKSAGEFKNRYTLPLYGCISLKNKKKHRDSISEVYQECSAPKNEKMLNRIRLACRKQGIEKICLAADFLPGAQEQECVDDMIRQLKEWGIDAVFVQNIWKETDCWEMLADIGTLLMVCQIGITTRRMIDDVMEFYLENGIVVIGAVAFEF